MAEPGAPEVTAVIATYNRADTVGRAVTSALGQQDVRLEVIVVDDGSTDDTPDVLAAFGDRIEVVRQDNRERGAARNAGVDRARSPHVAFLDSDDEWLPGHCAGLLTALRARPTAAFAYSSAQVVEPARSYVIPRRPASGDVFRALLVANRVPFSASMVVREPFLEVGGFPEDRTLCAGGGEDWTLWLRLAERWPAVHVPEVTARYHLGGGNTVADLERHGRAVRMAAELAAELPRTREERLERLTHAAVGVRLSRAYRDLGQPMRAAEVLVREVVARPGILRVPAVWSQIAAIGVDALTRRRSRGGDVPAGG